MSGSQQLRRFRIAHRAGSSIEDAARLAGMSLIEARAWAKDDAENPPPADAYRPLGAAYCASCAHLPCGCFDAHWIGGRA